MGSDLSLRFELRIRARREHLPDPVRKVCIISPYPPQRGGISEYTNSLAEELAKHLKVIVLAQQTDLPQNAGDSSRVLVKRLWNKNSLFAPFAILREITRMSPDVVHFQYESYGLYGIFDFLTTPLLFILLRFGKRKEVITLHSFLSTPSERTRDRDYIESNSFGKAKKYLYQVLRTTVKISLRLTDAIIVHSEFTAERVARATSHRDRISVIPIGSELPKSRLSKQEAKMRLGFNAKNIILFFGFISASKNIQELIDASRDVLDRNPDTLVVISGIPSEFDPDSRRYHEELRRRASWTSKIVFIDRFVDKNEMEQLFSSADVLVLTYSIEQGSSAALSTSLGYGVPVVVPKGGISATDVLSNDFGLVYEQGEVQSLAKCVIQIVSDDVLKGRLSSNASKVARKRSWEAVAERTLQVYELEPGAET